MFRENGIKYPICIDGKNACPPEDCGGVDGYYSVIEVTGACTFGRISSPSRTLALSLISRL